MTAKPQAAMLFAAGFGTRMGALTKDMPKPMINVAGRPLIDHTLGIVASYGPLNCVANVHYKPDVLINYLRPRDVQISHEHPDILDTGGGLKAALPLLGSEPVFTLNTDAVWSGPNPLSFLADLWNPDEMDALLICVPVQNALGRITPGDFSVDENGKITRKGDYVFGGVQVLKTDDVAACNDTVFSLNKIWDQIARSGRLSGAVYPGFWCDVGHPKGVKLAETLLSEPDV